MFCEELREVQVHDILKSLCSRKTMGRASSLLIIFLVLGSSFATYNVVTMIRHYGSSEGVAVDDGALFFDPITEMPDHVKNRKTSKAPFHVALTATDAPYNKWQCRVMYYWYKQQKKLPGSEMGGFTRILHSGNPDNLMDEIPTVVVDPLPAGLDRVSLLQLFIIFFFMLFANSLCFSADWIYSL